MPEAVFYYFDGRGLGECIRMMLCVMKQKFREVLIEERSQFLELKEKGRLQFDQLPLLEIDGMDMVQSGAILRYLAHKGGMLGEGNPKVTARIDMLFEGTRDLLKMFLSFGFAEEQKVRENITSIGLPRYLPVYNKILGGSATGLLVGQFLSLADMGLYEVLQLTVEYFGEEALKDYEHIKKFYEMMIGRPDMKLYFEKYKKRKNDEKYVEAVERILEKQYRTK